MRIRFQFYGLFLMVYIVSSSHSFFNSWPTNSETIKQVKKPDVIDEFLSWWDHIDLI